MSFNRLNRAQVIEEEGKIILGLFQNKIEEDVEDLFFEFRGLIIIKTLAAYVFTGVLFRHHHFRLVVVFEDPPCKKT